MGLWSSLVAGRRDEGVVGAALEVENEAAPAFSVDVDSGVLYGTPTLDDYIFRAGQISRAEALRVPAVKRARDLICGTIGQFPLRVLDPEGKPATTFSPNLFQQPEVGVAPSVTWTRVVEDLFFDGISWLKVMTLGWHGRPIESRRLEPDTVTIQPRRVQYSYGSAEIWPEVQGLIRIDSPNAGILGLPAIRACIALERAALRHLDGTPPVDYFTPENGVDPFSDADDVRTRLLDPWQVSRNERSTGYVPAGVKYNVAGWDPDKLQLAEAREFAITEVARLTGIDAEELSVSTTSRTYFNSQDRRRQRVEDVLGPYMSAIEGRLSMADMTPRGFTSSFDPSAYLRLDDLAAAQTDAVLISAKVLDPEEARAKRGLQPRQTPPAEPDTQRINDAVTAAAAHQAAELAAATERSARRA